MIRMLMAAAALTAAMPALADGFAPGKWEHQTKTVSAEGTGYPQWLVKMFSNSSRKSCFTPAQAAHPEILLTQDDAAVCRMRRFSMAEGKLVYDTFCTNKRFPAGLLVASKGNYTADSYAITTSSTGVKDGAQVKIVTTGTGKRTAPACK